MAAIVPSYLSAQYSAKELIDKLAAGSAPITREYEVYAKEGPGFWSFTGKGYAIAAVVCGIFYAVSRAITLSPLAMTLNKIYGVTWGIYVIGENLYSKFRKKELSEVEDIYAKMARYITAKYEEKAGFLEEKYSNAKSQDKGIENLTHLVKAFDEGKVDLPQPAMDEHVKLRAQVAAILKREAPVKPVHSHKWYNGCLFHDCSWHKVEDQWMKFRNSCHRYYNGFPLQHEGMRTYMKVLRDPNVAEPTYILARW